MAVTPTLVGFKDRFPEFEAAGVADARITALLEETIAILEETAWGDCYTQAVYLYTAHILLLAEIQTQKITNGGLAAGQGSPAGPIVSSGADGLSAGFATPTYERFTDMWWGQTPYGQQYLILRAQCLIPQFVQGC